MHSQGNHLVADGLPDSVGGVMIRYLFWRLFGWEMVQVVATHGEGAAKKRLSMTCWYTAGDTDEALDVMHGVDEFARDLDGWKLTVTVGGVAVRRG